MTAFTMDKPEPETQKWWCYAGRTWRPIPQLDLLLYCASWMLVCVVCCVPLNCPGERPPSPFCAVARFVVVMPPDAL